MHHARVPVTLLTLSPPFLTTAARHANLLLFTSVLALLAPLLALDIENLERLKTNLDEIINLHSDEPHPDGDGENMQRSRASDPRYHGWPKDCSEVSAGSPSGVYVIQPTGLHPIVVYCEMNVTDGGWTVIQRNRQSTEITWAESWSTYKYGFGNVHTEYWLGTEYIHQISKQKVYQVRFVIWDAANNINFADYNLFSLEDESHGYRLRLGSYTGTAEDAMEDGPHGYRLRLGTYSGLAGDAMATNSAATVHDNMKFSAKDLDQDTYSGNCASSYGGGWWYSACYSVRLNVKGGITWGSLCNGNCKASAILIKPAPYC
ncbi:PREDICTED: fibrinogen-like protein A [Pygoscelis adeliae]|uniref:fibrinogen-like protein A n=1 Tax=Pygoscelis adeliae TaxID=9238 RepID=UPI0004F4F656|nr:PREDICTED: fibrinogen-like protein A [Pygoscelis adeliae]